jgi:nitronate monooxygenase
MFTSRVKQLITSLKIRYPIIQAPMAGGATTAKLVSAVANAGGLGSLAGAYLTPSDLRKEIQAIRQLTDKPFSVNLFVPQAIKIEAEKISKMNLLLNKFRQHLSLPQQETVTHENHNSKDEFNEQLNVLVEENVAIISFVFGIPEQHIINKLKSNNITLIGTATNIREGILLEQAGFDLIVAQGSEAGGHRGNFNTQYKTSLIGTMALVPQMSNMINTPIIAAGGIMDGRGLVAALALGASAVQMGTAFLTCDECGSHPLYKEAILASTEESTVLTSVFSGKMARGIKNHFIEELEDSNLELPDFPIQNGLTQDIRKAAAKQNKINYMSLWAGQGTRLSRSISAAKLIENIMQEAKQVLEKNIR